MIGVVTGTVAAGTAVAGGLLLDRLAVATIRPPHRPVDRTPAELGHSFRDVSFESTGHALRGWCIEPDDSTDGPMVVLVHGWSSNSSTMLRLAEPLAASGYATLAFDVRGHGRSDPAAYCTIRHYRDDVVAALRFVDNEWPGRAKVLMGHSMGAAAATLVAADRSSELAGLALLAGPADVMEVTADYLSDRGLPGPLLARVLLPFWRFRAGASFDRLRPDLRASEIDVPTVIVHGEHDRRVPLRHAHRLSDATGVPVTVVKDRSHTDVLDSSALHDAVLGLMQRTTRPMGPPNSIRAP